MKLRKLFRACFKIGPNRNPPNGSRWIVKVRPGKLHRQNFNDPPTAVGGIQRLASLFVGWDLTIPQLPLGELNRISKRVLTGVTVYLVVILAALSLATWRMQAQGEQTGGQVGGQ